MGRRFVLSLVLLLCAEATFAQVATTSSTSTSTINPSLPVAYVYVSSSHYIHAYKAWANGTYTSITGSPFPFAGIRKMSVTKKFLFGTDGANLVTYSIHSNGSISKLSSIKPGMYQSSGCTQNGFGTQVDFSQTTLYYLSCLLWIQHGQISFLPHSVRRIIAVPRRLRRFHKCSYSGTPEDLTKMGGNVFAFDSYCNDETDQGVIQIFKRQSNGDLIFFGEDNTCLQPLPAQPSAWAPWPLTRRTTSPLPFSASTASPTMPALSSGPPSSQATPRIRTAISPQPAMSTTCRCPPRRREQWRNCHQHLPGRQVCCRGWRWQRISGPPLQRWQSTHEVQPRISSRVITFRSSAGTRRATSTCSPPSPASALTQPTSASSTSLPAACRRFPDRPITSPT